MKVDIQLVFPGDIQFDPPALCRIEIRDVSLMDAPALILASREIKLSGAAEDKPLRTTLEISDSGMGSRDLVVWAHLSRRGEKRIHAGDFITTVSYPVKVEKSETQVRISLSQV